MTIDGQLYEYALGLSLTQLKNVLDRERDRAKRYASDPNASETRKAETQADYQSVREACRTRGLDPDSM